MTHFVTLLLLLAALIAATKAGGALAARFGQPNVFGEILTGLILGPTAVNLLHFPIFAEHSLHVAVKDMAEIGVILLMFLAGLETDLDRMKKVGFAALTGGIGGVLFPFAGGWWLASAFGYPLWESVFIGTVLTATSVSISVQTLVELRRLHGKEGTTILGAAVIDDIIGVLLLSFVVAVAGLGGEAGVGGGNPALKVGLVVLRMVVFFAIAIGLGRLFKSVMRWLAGEVEEHQPVFTFVVIVILLYSWGAEFLGGLAAITGAFTAGILLGETRYREMIEDRMKVFSYALFVPLFFASIGLEANARNIASSINFALLITLIAIVTKMFGAMLGVRMVGYSTRESLSFGIGMISRGEVALIMSAIGLQAGIINESIFSVMVLMTLVTTLITPVLLRWSFRTRLFPRTSAGSDATR